MEYAKQNKVSWKLRVPSPIHPLPGYAQLPSSLDLHCARDVLLEGIADAA